MTNEEKKWVENCIETFDSLRQNCLDIDDNFVADRYLEQKVETIFPIFKKISCFNVFIEYQDKTIFDYEDINCYSPRKKIFLAVLFPKKHIVQIIDWFSFSVHGDYKIISLKHQMGIIISFEDVLEYLNQQQIIKLKKQLKG